MDWINTEIFSGTGLFAAQNCVSTLPLHNTTNVLEHIKKARNSTHSLLTVHTCQLKPVPGDDLMEEPRKTTE